MCECLRICNTKRTHRYTHTHVVISLFKPINYCQNNLCQLLSIIRFVKKTNKQKCVSSRMCVCAFAVSNSGGSFHLKNYIIRRNFFSLVRFWLAFFWPWLCVCLSFFFSAKRQGLRQIHIMCTHTQWWPQFWHSPK